MPTYRNLDRTPRIFFMPGDQIFPWLIIFGISYFILKQLLGLSWLVVCIVSLWGIVSWWTLTAKGMYTFFGRLVKTPLWCRAIVPYQSVLSRNHGQKNRSQTIKRPRR